VSLVSLVAGAQGGAAVASAIVVGVVGDGMRGDGNGERGRLKPGEQPLLAALCGLAVPFRQDLGGLGIGGQE